MPSSSSSSSLPAANQSIEIIDDNEVWTKFILSEFKRFNNLDNLEDTKWKMLNILKENLLKDRMENKYSNTSSAAAATTSAAAGSSTETKRRRLNNGAGHFDKYDHDYY